MIRRTEEKPGNNVIACLEKMLLLLRSSQPITLGPGSMLDIKHVVVVIHVLFFF